MEHATDHSVAQLRYTPPDVINRKAERQNAGVLHLDAVIKYSHPDRSAAFCVVSVYNCIHDRLAKRDQRNRPAIDAPGRGNYGFATQMLLDERNCLIDGRRQVGADFA